MGVAKTRPSEKRPLKQTAKLTGAAVLVLREMKKSAMDHIHPSRCPLNVAGPFYTLGTCMACEAPEAEAPDLLAPLTDDNLITHFVKQPATPEEIERACKAIQVCCVTDLRYGGTDLAIVKRLGNGPLVCDYTIQDGHLVLSDQAVRGDMPKKPVVSARLLAWYTSVVLVIDTLLLLFVSVAPGAENRFLTLQVVFAASAFVIALLGVVLAWLPRAHWCNRSSTMRGVLSVAAVVASILLALSVG